MTSISGVLTQCSASLASMSLDANTHIMQSIICSAKQKALPLLSAIAAPKEDYSGTCLVL